MNRIAKALAVALLLNTLSAARAWAQGTYKAADCNQSSVNAVINGPTHVAVNGDVIQIPAGSCTWTSGITVARVGITITGTGTPNSNPSTTGPSASCTQTAITVNNVGNMFTLSPGTSTSLTRLSCIKILSTNPTSIGPPITAWGTCDSSTCPELRLDNITFDSSLHNCCASQSNSLITTDNIFGVIDHNTAGAIDLTWPPIEFINYMNSAWKGVGDYGDNSWASASNFGSSELLYLENNSFGQMVIIGETEAQAGGHEGGGRIVGRFNTCNGCWSGLSNHGTETNGRPRGGRQVEFYGNSFVCTNTSAGCQGGVPVRSGVNLMFGNSLTVGPGSWFNQYLALAIMRTQGISSAPWNNCPGPYDQSSPLICFDQPSRSGGTLISGNPPTPTGWNNEVIDPSYEWKDSGYNPPFGNVSVTATPSSLLIANRDWYTDNSLGTPHPQTSPTSPFNGAPSGAIGMGFGTLANRPTSCTPHVGYWATDQGNWNQSANSFGQGQLFVCTATNTWTLYYTPYTYPHPLTGGGAPPPALAPPTNLKAATQ